MGQNVKLEPVGLVFWRPESQQIIIHSGMALESSGGDMRQRQPFGKRSSEREVKAGKPCR